MSENAQLRPSSFIPIKTQPPEVSISDLSPTVQLTSHDDEVNQILLQQQLNFSTTDSSGQFNNRNRSIEDLNKIICPYCVSNVTPRIESQRNCCKISDDCFVLFLSCLECILSCKPYCCNKSGSGFRSTFSWHHCWSLQIRQFCPKCGNLISDTISR